MARLRNFLDTLSIYQPPSYHRQRKIQIEFWRKTKPTPERQPNKLNRKNMKPSIKQLKLKPAAIPRLQKSCSSRLRPSLRARSGSLLLIVLVAIVVLSLSAYTFTALMQTEEEASRLMTLQMQTKYLVDSGMDYTRLYLSQSEATIREKGGKWDNTDIFQAIPVAVSASNPRRIGYFSIITSNMDQDGFPDGNRFGLIDESSRINLNTLLYVDDDLRYPETESSYYTSEDPPYECKNGPLDSLDELLLIRGVTPQMLFGLDLNRNGLIDNDEAAAADSSNAGGDMDLGWSNYLTLYSKESNLTGEGLPRININGDDLEQLYDDLKSAYNDEWANFIIYYRCATANPGTEPPPQGSVIVNAAQVPIF